MPQTFDTPEGPVEVDLPEGQKPQCTSIPVMKQVKKDPASMPKNYRAFLVDKNGDEGDEKETRVRMTISRNVRKSPTLLEILELSVNNLVADPDVRIDHFDGFLHFRTDILGSEEIEDLVDAIGREFQYQKAMLKNAQAKARKGPQQLSHPRE